MTLPVVPMVGDKAVSSRNAIYIRIEIVAVVQNNVTASPLTPWSQNLVEPAIHHTAYVHAFSNIIGDVRICPNRNPWGDHHILADADITDNIGKSVNVGSMVNSWLYQILRPRGDRKSVV